MERRSKIGKRVIGLLEVHRDSLTILPKLITDTEVFSYLPVSLD